MTHNPHHDFEIALDILEGVFAEELDINLPQTATIEADGETWEVGGWLHQRRIEYHRGALSPYRTAALEGLGIDWSPRDSGAGRSKSQEPRYLRTELPAKKRAVLTATERKIERIRTFLAGGGTLTQRTVLDLDGQAWKVGKWIDGVRRTADRLPTEHITALEGLGISMEIGPSAEERFQTKAAYLSRWAKRHGKASITACEAPDTGAGRNIHIWIRDIRIARRRGRISETRIEQLDGIGFVWEPSKA